MNENEKRLKKEMMKSKKLKNSELVQENFKTRSYIYELSLSEARILFKFRSQMTQYVKMNFSHNTQYSKTQWKCNDCHRMDSENHLLWCESYKKLRENKNLDNDKDLCKYLHDILVHRTKQDMESKKKDQQET